MTKLKSLYKSTDYGRCVEPPERSKIGKEPYRSDFRRDYARVIHSAAFRRLQGKTQLFPGWESDFFRNRLTHSLEVAQVAASIAHRINHTIAYFKKQRIDPEIVNVAGLVHDIGHPPFGHNGEKALDDCMKEFGGFEGNAQTLRILSRLEKKELASKSAFPFGVTKAGKDGRLGLNLTFRVLASCLKYDNEIPVRRNAKDSLVKGYYACDAEIVGKIKKNVAPDLPKMSKFKTIECQIMDLADDIAYSTYDMEDSLKAGFLKPFDILSISDEILQSVAEKVSTRTSEKMRKRDVLEALLSLFGSLFKPSEGVDPANPDHFVYSSIRAYSSSKDLSEVGYIRTDFTSDLISRFISGIRVRTNSKNPQLSSVYFDKETLRMVEVLKNFTYEATIMSPRLKVAEYRGYEIVSSIFKSLAKDRGSQLLPEDFKGQYERFRHTDEKMRVICDFIAGMTDRYALEFYGRLNSERPQTIFKPM